MKNKKLRLTLFLFILSLFSCGLKNKKADESLEFIPIKWTVGKLPMDTSDSLKGYRYREAIWVKNYDISSSSRKEAMEMMLKYREEQGKDFTTMDINKYLISFFVYNNTTKIYDEQDYRNTWNGITLSLWEDDEYFIGNISMERCDSVANTWSQIFGINDRDSDYWSYYVSDSCASFTDDRFYNRDVMSYPRIESYDNDQGELEWRIWRYN